MEKQEQKKSWWSDIKGLLLAVLAALAIRSVWFEPYNIPSSSMVPTLLVGDYLIVSKYNYGYSKHSFPFSIPLIPHGRLFGHAPERGDIVVFKVPTNNKVDYIKRVIGLPGDRIQMQGGRLYINDSLVPREKISEEDWVVEQEGSVHYTKYIETLPNGVKHFIYERSDTMMQDDTEVFTVPEDYYFMMGDNRDNSQDSRFFGFVPAENLEGKARFIFYSNNGSGDFWQFWKWKDSLRLKRFFRGLYQ
ncbi:MAG: signal peptidase I [Alphaproteobacteria bacterium]|nr:signal peptidase I [Alphaproteobacteria bacterium]